MIKNYFLITFLLVGISISNAQEVTFEKVKQLYEKFESNNVIKYSDLLLEKGTLSDSLSIEVHLMRANIFYSNGADSSTRKSFENILKIKKKYIPDPDVTSPKLISIFNEVKADYLIKNPDIVQQPDSTNNKPPVKFVDLNPERIAVIKNILLPGLGPLHYGSSAKGWLTTSASILNLGTLIYFAIDANKKQNDYFIETDRTLIPLKYDDYNRSYKIRNALLISYAAIWLYSQIDFLFFSENKQQLDESFLSRYMDLNPTAGEFKLNFKFPF
ncbi:hypothetical protein C0389_05595 [bacterium]|nr:hypothetical protein [bacterium]